MPPVHAGGKAAPRPDEIQVRRMVASGRDAALAYAERMAARTCMAGGDLWVPTQQVAWLVNPVTYAPKSVNAWSGRLHQDGVAFPVGARHEALAHARWLIETKGMPTHRAPIIERGWVEIEREDLVPYLDPGFLARRELGKIARGEFGNGFPTLPLEALDAWTGFRRAYRDLGAGDLDAMDAAYEALRRMLESLPDAIRGPGKQAADELQALLPGHLRYHREFLSHLPRPEPEPEDAAALASL